eukprot:281553_1
MTFSCDGCRQKMQQGQQMYGCRTCNYDLCKKCHNTVAYAKQQAIQKSQNEYKIHKRPKDDDSDDEELKANPRQQYKNDNDGIQITFSDIYEERSNTKQLTRGNKRLNKQDLMNSIQYFANIFSSLNHSGFNVLSYVHIHGGTPRDILTNKPVKDIDLIIDIRSIQLHAKQCKNYNCILSKHYQQNKNEYTRIKKTKDNFGSVSQWEKEMETNGEFLSSKKIINCKYFVDIIEKHMKSNQNKMIAKIKRIPKSKTLPLYQIFFNNNIDFDMVDCSFYGVSIGTIQRQMPWNGNQFQTDEIWPFSYEQHVVRSDCTFNGLSIIVSDIVGIPMNQWKNKIHDPFAANTMLGKLAKSNRYQNAIHHLLNRQIIGYINKSNVNFLTLTLTMQVGQVEMFIYRLIKNCTKVGGNAQDPIYIDINLISAIWLNYSKLFVRLKDKSYYERFIRHIFAHNYYKKQGVTEDLVLSVFHAFWYDGAIFAMYKHNELFRREINVAVKKYNKQAFWNKLLNQTKHMNCEMDGYKVRYPRPSCPWNYKHPNAMVRVLGWAGQYDQP